mgnify:CR=1 FL=1
MSLSQEEIQRALREYLKEVYKIKDEDIKCEDNICYTYVNATKKDIEEFNEIYESEEEFYNGYYDYAFMNNNRIYIHVEERFLPTEEIEIRVIAMR